MIDVNLNLSNDGARTAQREIRAFLRHETSRIATNKPDERDEATVGYVVLRSLMEKINIAIARQDADEARRRQQNRPPPPTIRERRT